MSTKRFEASNRLWYLWMLAFVLLGAVALRLIDIQVLRHEFYKAQAESNRTQTIFQVAPRGNIYASGGQAIASSQPSFDLYYLPASSETPPGEDELQTLSEVIADRLGDPADKVINKFKEAIKSGKAVIIAENISVANALPIAELQNYYPGIYLIEESKRHYPYNEMASHLVGYLSSMAGGAWRNRDKSLDYRLDSKIGNFGLEKKYEKELKGVDGGLLLEVDYRGRVKRIIEDRRWEKGADIHLTLNFEVQRAAEEGLKNSKTGTGAAVALDPATGAVLAIATAPAFDPNIFVPYKGTDTEKEIKKIKEYNLAVQGVYPPASPFKVITAAAALELGKVNLDHKNNCPGHFDAGARVFKCWKAHGHTDFWKAMAESCDTYFYNLSLQIGAVPMEIMQHKFMIGRPTGIDIPGERSGNLFGPSRRAKNRSYWFVGDTLNLSIGQGELLVTPAKMAQFAAAVASKGKVWRPYYLDKITAPDGTVVFTGQPELLQTADLKPGNWDILFKSLKGVTDKGTGRSARVRGIDVYSKTGTAQNPHGEDHAWFIAFAARPGEQPDIALAVFVEHGKSGSAQGGPIAKKMLEAYYNIKPPAPQKAAVKKEPEPKAEKKKTAPPLKAEQKKQTPASEIGASEKEFYFMGGI